MASASPLKMMYLSYVPLSLSKLGNLGSVNVRAYIGLKKLLQTKNFLRSFYEKKQQLQRRTQQLFSGASFNAFSSAIKDSRAVIKASRSSCIWKVKGEVVSSWVKAWRFYIDFCFNKNLGDWPYVSFNCWSNLGKLNCFHQISSEFINSYKNVMILKTKLIEFDQISELMNNLSTPLEVPWPSMLSSLLRARYPPLGKTVVVKNRLGKCEKTKGFAEETTKNGRFHY